MAQYKLFENYLQNLT